MGGETVIVAGFSHETNTFVTNPSRTTREDFDEQVGDDVIDTYRGTETAEGGVIAFADEHDITLLPILSATATPGAPVGRDTFEHYAGEIVDGVTAHSSEADGIILLLHGAMVTEHCHDGEGELLRRLRDNVGEELPISVTLDLHGNVSSAMSEHADALVGFKTYPHLDKATTGRLGMEILLADVRGDVSPTMYIERPPQLVYPPRGYTPSGPMREIMDLARAHESHEDVLAVSVFSGYYHADIPEMGVCTVVVTDRDADLAGVISRELASTLWERREEFVAAYPGPREAVAEAKALADGAEKDAGPVVMGDFGSNPGGGGASDGTTIPREMLEQGVANAGYAIMYDPEVVEACLDAGVGAELTVTLGGKTDDQHGEPLTDLPVYVKAITDGRYVNTGTSHTGQGVQNDLGPTVHLQCGEYRDLNVIVSGTRASAFDAEVWRHMGIQPERLDVLCIPSFVAFLGDYEPFASDVILADTPGASAVDPHRFEYRHIPRPIYPLDAMSEDHYPGPAHE